MLENVAQPSMFRGSLKPYQIKGLNWLVNLYDQGINGILADESTSSLSLSLSLSCSLTSRLQWVSERRSKVSRSSRIWPRRRTSGARS